MDIEILDGVEIPPRKRLSGGGKGTQYPFESMQAGQAFRLQFEGKEGQTKKDGTELSAAEDCERQARQRQSYFSTLGKRLGINVVTRYVAHDDDTGTLTAWHGGSRDEAEDAEAEDAEAEEIEDDEDEDDEDDLEL